MALPLPPSGNQYTSISRLNRDILWNIFNINAELDPPLAYWFPQSDPHLSPLTSTRRSSQVCSFWREIILESPSIWGNCIDLDLLWQESDDWRREVLQRTDNALLSVRGRRPLTPCSAQDPNGVGLQRFALDIIFEHWARIQVLDIVISSAKIFEDYMRTWTVFRRPAQHLRVFSIQNRSLPGPLGDGSGFTGMEFPPMSPLFANNAPLLAHFSVGASVVSSPSLSPIPSILLTGQLRHLVLDQPLVIPAHALLAACAKMPLLEDLIVNVANTGALILGRPRDTNSTSSATMISLPHLRSITICSLGCLDIFPAFLGRIAARPGCQWVITTAISEISLEKTNPNALAVFAEEIQPIIMRYMSSFFAENSLGPSFPTSLTLELAQNQLCLSINETKNWFMDAYFSTSFEGIIPSVLQEGFARALLSLSYPISLVQFRFSPQFLYSLPSYIPSLAPFFLALKSIEELYTTVEGLSYLTQSNAEDFIFFKALHTVILTDTGPLISPFITQHIKSFFVNRQHICPVAVLNLTELPLCYADLRPLDGITGLKVVWKVSDPEPKTMEYVCGSGSPKYLDHSYWTHKT